jgi:hypothetical protein
VSTFVLHPISRNDGAHAHRNDVKALLGVFVLAHDAVHLVVHLEDDFWDRQFAFAGLIMDVMQVFGRVACLEEVSPQVAKFAVWVASHTVDKDHRVDVGSKLFGCWGRRVWLANAPARCTRKIAEK